ncbi:unnamed protein product, partial [Rotaria sp. Silwood2]
MITLASTPYDILGAKKADSDYKLRVAYYKRIHQYKKDRLESPENRRITPEYFTLICRAYETLSDQEKRKKYDEDGEWIQHIPLKHYTLQQLAAEPELINELKLRLQNVTLREINAQDSQTGQTVLYCAARVCNIEAVNCL